MKLDLPSDSQRIRYLEHELKKIQSQDCDVQELARQTRGLSYRDMDAILKSACRIPYLKQLRETAFSDIDKISILDRSISRLKADDLIQAVYEYRRFRSGEESGSTRIDKLLQGKALASFFQTITDAEIEAVRQLASGNPEETVAVIRRIVESIPSGEKEHLEEAMKTLFAQG
jgi:SpoVK/Ycf46/Vps4 family AAA+-type ATPase